METVILFTTRFPLSRSPLSNAQYPSRSSTGIPVYNVSAPALRKTGKPYRVVEL
jgi:hypothetical protein